MVEKIIQYGTLAFVFLIPWQSRWLLAPGELAGGYWEYGTQSLYATEVLLGIVIVAVLIRAAISLPRARFRFSFKRFLSPAGALFLLVLWAGVSMLWSIDPAIALEHWLVLVEGVLLLLLSSSGAIQFSHIAWTVIVSAVLQSIIGIGQFLFQVVPGSTILGMASQSADVLGASVIETASGRWLRAYGSFPHPNILGAWLVLALVLALERWRRFTSRDAVAYGSFFLLAFGLLATFSRAAWLAFFVVLAYDVAKTVIRRCVRQVSDSESAHATTLIGLAVATVFLFAWLYPEPFFSRITTHDRLTIRSNAERMSGISEGWQLIRQHPFLGVGAGNYGLGVRRDVAPGHDAWHYQPVHNVPLLVWAELGIVGVLLITAFIFFIAVRQLYTIPLLDSGMLLVPLAILGFFDHYLWSLYPGMMIFAVFLALEIRRKTNSISS